MMKRFGPLILFLVAACESGPEDVPPKTPMFVTDDCALIAAIGREKYDLSRDDPRMTIRLNGEDAPWTPGCDWQSSGFNLVEVRGPEGEAATAGMNRLVFHRPRYDAQGALVRTSVTEGGVTTYALCRVVRNSAGWAVDACGPDPKLTQPRPDAPSITDATPDSRLPGNLPGTGDRQPSARDLAIPERDPGAPPVTPN